MSIESKDIMILGGGHGTIPLINGAQHAKFDLDAPIGKIDVTTSTTDSGGLTGQLRRNYLGRLGLGDAASQGKALWDIRHRGNPQQQAVMKLFGIRNGNQDAAAYAIMHNLLAEDPERGFDATFELLEQAGVPFVGGVYPSTVESTHIRFFTKSGRKDDDGKPGIRGEHRLDEFVDEQVQDPVIDMILDPSVPAHLPATEAIKKAQMVILSAGSIHGSVACIALPEGMKEAIKASNADWYLVTNLADNSIEPTATPSEYVSLMEKYYGIGRIKGIIVPDLIQAQKDSRLPGVKAAYSRKSQRLLLWNQEELTRFQASRESDGLKTEVLLHQATNIVEANGNGLLLRHDPEAMAEVFDKLARN